MQIKKKILIIFIIITTTLPEAPEDIITEMPIRNYKEINDHLTDYTESDNKDNDNNDVHKKEIIVKESTLACDRACQLENAWFSQFIRPGSDNENDRSDNEKDSKEKMVKRKREKKVKKKKEKRKMKRNRHSKEKMVKRKREKKERKKKEKKKMKRNRHSKEKRKRKRNPKTRIGEIVRRRIAEMMKISRGKEKKKDSKGKKKKKGKSKTKNSESDEKKDSDDNEEDSKEKKKNKGKSKTKNSENDECGLENLNDGMTNIMSGGQNAVVNKYPWMVHIVGTKTNGKPSRCGGSIISDTLVLTSLHCVKEVQSWDGVKIGAHNLDNNNFQLVQPKEAVWPDTHERADVAIIILDKSVDLSEKNIGTVCLPSNDDEDYRGKKALTLGWGRLANNELSKTLRKVDLTIARINDDLYMFTDVEKINGIYQDPCAGDSGGPLLYKENYQWTIIATIRGGGFNCKTQLVSTKYAGLGRWNKLSPHLDWIKCVLKEDSDRCGSKSKKW